MILLIMATVSFSSNNKVAIAYEELINNARKQSKKTDIFASMLKLDTFVPFKIIHLTYMLNIDFRINECEKSSDTLCWVLGFNYEANLKVKKYVKELVIKEFLLKFQSLNLNYAININTKVVDKI